MDEPSNNKRLRSQSSPSLSPTNIQKNPRIVSPESNSNLQKPELEGASISNSSGHSDALIQDISAPDLLASGFDTSMASSSNRSTQDYSQVVDEVNPDREPGGTVVTQEQVDKDTINTDKHDYFGQKENRFQESSSSPYIVYLIDTKPGKNLGNLHPIDVGGYLLEVNIQVESITSAGPEKAALIFDSALSANAFVETGISLLPKSWRAFIPNSCIYKVGVIQKFKPTFTEKDFWEGLDETSNKIIEQVEFMRKKIVQTINGQDSTSFEFIGTIKIYVKEKLPPYVFVRRALKTVERFVPKIKRCFKCQRFGHVNTNCSHTLRCQWCGRGHHGDDCTNEYSCANCGGNHHAADKKCVLYGYNLDIMELKAKLESNYTEAAALVGQKLYVNFDILIEEDSIIATEEGILQYQASKAVQNQKIFPLSVTRREGTESVIQAGAPRHGLDTPTAENFSHEANGSVRSGMVERLGNQILANSRSSILKQFGEGAESFKVFQSLEAILQEAVNGIINSPGEAVDP